MLRVVLLLVAIVASVSATCIGAGFAAAYQAGTGINPVPVGVSTDPVSVSKLPICGGTDAFPKQADGTYLTCCSLDAFNQIRAFGEEYTTAIEAVTASTVAFNNAKDQLDKAKKQICAQVPTACDQFSQVIDILKTFLDGFSKHYPQCSAAYRDYLEGAFCAVCRPDFFPAIASQSGSTITFYWAPETCTDIASACAPVVNDIYNLIVQFSTAFGSLNLATGTSAPSFGDFLADVPGATNAEKISYWLCNAQLRGVNTVDFVGVQTIASSLGYALAGSGLKRDQLENVLSEHANRLRDASRTLSLRQSSNAANSYNGTYNPVAVGAKSNFIGSAATVTISFAAFVFAMIAVFLF